MFSIKYSNLKTSVDVCRMFYQRNIQAQTLNKKYKNFGDVYLISFNVGQR